ncbi:ARF guanine-nucleotide exchange factor GNOM [Platanthera zijinensis]|uniref:ARF guanine-nucleotide exchange factor GNOM n=1 Tax=Platanthera zijinensis TaxID=2320716 RepID=A0AAP0B203_9ASPA
MQVEKKMTEEDFIRSNDLPREYLSELYHSICKNEIKTIPDPGTAMFEEELGTTFGGDTKARLATETLFNIANTLWDHIHAGWRNILNCILRLHKPGLLPARVAGDAADEAELPADAAAHGKAALSSLLSSHISSLGAPRWSSGLMGRFTQLLSLDADEPRSHPTEQQLAALQNNFAPHLQSQVFAGLMEAILRR